MDKQKKAKVTTVKPMIKYTPSSLFIYNMHIPHTNIGKQEENLAAAFPAILRSMVRKAQTWQMSSPAEHRNTEPEPVTQGLMDRFPACFCINK